MVRSQTNGYYFKVKKMDVSELAQKQEIFYIITDTIFKVKRDTMILI